MAETLCNLTRPPELMGGVKLSEQVRLEFDSLLEEPCPKPISIYTLDRYNRHLHIVTIKKRIIEQDFTLAFTDKEGFIDELKGQTLQHLAALDAKFKQMSTIEISELEGYTLKEFEEVELYRAVKSETKAIREVFKDLDKDEIGISSDERLRRKIRHDLILDEQWLRYRKLEQLYWRGRPEAEIAELKN